MEEGDLRALNRQVVKSDHATLRVPELDFEIEAGTQKAQLTTVEGIMSSASKNLQAQQEERRQQYPEIAEKIDVFCSKLDKCATGQMKFTIEVDDPSGNSYIESYDQDLSKDENLQITYYERTRDQNEKLGLKVEDQSEQEAGAPPPEIAPNDPHHGPGAYGIVAPGAAVARARNGEIEKVFGKYTSPEEVMVFPGTCDNCGADAQTRMFVTNIPFFGEVIIMSNACDTCGSKNSEVKPGGGVSDKGHTITLKVVDEIDMNRDVIKSDTASVTIPYLDLTTSLGTMGGIVTTVEGLLKEVEKTLRSTGRFQIGDSATDEDKQKWTDWFAKFEKLYTLEEPFTIELDDPLGHCFITPLEDKIEDDDRLTVVEYERTPEQDAEFGIADMKLNEEMNNLD